LSYDDFADIYNRRWGGFAVRVIEVLDFRDSRGSWRAKTAGHGAE